MVPKVKELEAEGKIDPLSNLRGQPAFVLYGENDRIIDPFLTEKTA